MERILKVTFPEPIKPQPFMVFVTGKKDELSRFIGDILGILKEELEKYPIRPINVSMVDKIGEGTTIDLRN